MNKSFSSRRFGAAAVLTAVTFVGGGLAMAPTASAGTVPPTYASTSTSPGQVTPDADVAGCYTVLDNFQELTNTTKAICITTAAGSIINASAAYGHCVFAMTGVGVNSKIAILACKFAAFG